MDPVRYRILGTTQALRPDGTPLPVGGARLRALLSALALRGGRAVPVQFLVDEVWGADPPADAPGALQALVGRLRRGLGADAVESVDGGYRLAARPDDIDLHRFDRLTADGLRALADGDPAKAAGVLDDALALWHGPALADLPDRTAEAARWETRRLDALRARHTAALALGQAEQALPELTALCDSHPLDEPLQALRLRALRDLGRPAEALAAYDDVRRLLAEQLGSDPGPELRELHAELLKPAERPPLGNLRARLTSFVGREADIEAIRADLDRARLVTLLGPGGAGKTRLSQEAAETLRDAARDGIWLAELAPVDDPEAVPEAVLTAVGARETVLYGAGAEEFRSVTDRHDDPVERLVEHCARRRLLIVLDNCEHVVDAAARLAEHLLARCPGLTVLATSREPLGVPGEVLRPVEPLLEPYALQLFADRGAAARPGFRVDDDPAACAEICRRLDGLPLAIELAAARLRMLTPRQIADRLDDRFRLLTSGSRTVLPRQQTLRAVVDWSWDLLDEDEREVLGRLSVFSGGCDLPAAEAVCGPAALDALGSLVDKSLVVAAPSGDGMMRYRLLETVAEYAGERLDESGQRAEAERAHLTYYRELARLTDPLLRGPDQLRAVERLQREYENLRTALRHAVAERDEQEALTLALSLAWYWQMRDLRIEARNWCAEVMRLGPDPFAAPAEPARPVWQKVTAEPPPYTGEVLAEARRGVHLAHLACMDTELDAWQNDAAQQKLRTIAETYPPGLPQSCRSPGLVAVFAVMLTGDMDAVAGMLDACVETSRTTPGYEWELAATLQMRANLLAHRPGRGEDAARDADESLALYERLGDSWGRAEALSARAEARERRGAYAEAAVDYRAALELARHLGARAQEAVLTARLAGALLEGGQGEEGERLLRQVLAEVEGGHNEAMPFSRVILAGWLSITGRIPEAREQIRMLRENFGPAQFHVFDAFILSGEAWMDAAEGLYEEALEKLRRALTQSDNDVARAMAPHLVSSCLVIAALALSGCRPLDGARCLGAAEALLPPGHPLSRLERECRSRAVATVRAALDQEAYETAYAEGGGLSAKEAAALV
ncbi:BTAD domain-containing putative transcriptional regulator [Streptomyces sp. GXMU-J15]|uniref:BTAD domain-containing putative transcriptional regulator n=1 Tax=Streptomyces fuscus TaxID=3048495 RepID=A0ABT7J2M7_9ACTN|nr:BTAD domain-containing putative transcriptional regulator [Streptomyces fuscus]MDL2079117.1 BTAD domain-containing putative transcriptional regulator [Streptomyces fuscus]